uniref:asparagine synthase (glutamine-hydrolyzing) n=1 Tax=viral metagenome TaxID=1070528 RepID=A0A6C0JKT3_9ZZZZ
MCGIFALLNNLDNLLGYDYIKKQFEKGKGRGPENSILKNIMVKTMFGFHRLAINGLDEISNQPIVIEDIAIICNGEIYNYKELYREMKINATTNSDCEVIIHLYKKYGIEHTLQLLDGVFAFVLIDYRMSLPEAKIYVARDPFGVRPLYYLKQNKENSNSKDFLENNRNEFNIYGFASELKMLYNIKKNLNENLKRMRKFNSHYDIYQFLPGTYSVFDLNFTVIPSWKITKNQIPYHSVGFSTNILKHKTGPEEIDEYLNAIIKNIQYYLRNAVEKRCCTTQRPIACLLSGGLDSSLIAALVNDYHIKNSLPTLETYSIGLAGSEDLYYAKIVADYLGTNHTEILVTEEDFLNAIPDVIYSIESYDTTTVRASIGNWLLGKYISENSEAKVIFNGDGSDELAGGYLYMNYACDQIEFDKECRRLLKDIYAFDVLRSDKSISSHGLEPRTPFLDRAWVQYYMSIPSFLRFHKISGTMEKSLIRSAFAEDEYKNSMGKAILPKEILLRRKEAFSDGVSKTSRSLYQIIQDYTYTKFMEEHYVHYNYLANTPEMYEQILAYDKYITENEDHLLPKTAEQFYYRKIFETHYNGMGQILPYFWMPKYIDAKDASARTLDIYGKENKNISAETSI